MHDEEEALTSPRERREKEFQDNHYHDEDEDVPVNDMMPRGTNPLPRRKPPRRPLPRRRYEED